MRAIAFGKTLKLSHFLAQDLLQVNGTFIAWYIGYLNLERVVPHGTKHKDAHWLSCIGTGSHGARKTGAIFKGLYVIQVLIFFVTDVSVHSLYFFDIKAAFGSTILTGTFQTDRVYNARNGSHSLWQISANSVHVKWTFPALCACFAIFEKGLVSVQNVQAGNNHISIVWSLISAYERVIFWWSIATRELKLLHGKLEPRMRWTTLPELPKQPATPIVVFGITLLLAYTATCTRIV